MKRGKLLKKISAAIMAGAILSGSIAVPAHAQDTDAQPDNSHLPGYEYIGEQVGTAFVDGHADPSQDGELSVQEDGGIAVVSVDESRYYYYGDWMTRWFYVTTSSGVHDGQCAIAENHTPRGNFAIHEFNDWRIKTLLACQPKGPLWDAYHTALWGPNDADTAYCFAHIAIAYVYTGRLSFVGAGIQDGIRNVVDYALPNVYEQQKELIDDYTAYVCYCSGVDSSYQDIVWMEYEPKQKNGYVHLQKQSALSGISSGNNCYSLEGAVYGVYTDAGCTNNVATLTTDDSGSSNTAELAAGQYYAREISAPKGFILDNTVYDVYIEAGGTGEITAADMPINDPVAIMLRKKDAETSKAVSGAEFTVKYFDAENEEDIKDDNCKSEWVFRTDEKGIITPDEAHKVSGDSFYLGMTGAAVFPLGYLTIQETKAPKGYQRDDTVYKIRIGSDTGGIVSDTFPENGYTIEEQPVRGDLDLYKYSERSGKALKGIPFRITSVQTGESHIIYTDEKGFASTSAAVTPHTCSTNEDTQGAGVWFGEIKALDDNKGALPFGDYVLDELECKANKGMDLIKGMAVSITADSKTVQLGDINNKTIKIATKAFSETTGTQILPAGSSEGIYDEVCYENLTPGRNTYKLCASLTDPVTGEVISSSESVFVPEKSSGTQKVVFEKIDTSVLGGKILVITEQLYDGDSLRASHSDLTDKDQMLYIPKIRTTAGDELTGDEVGRTTREMTITDVVKYKGLKPGETYTLTGKLMDKETGEPIQAEGKEIVSVKEFTPESSDGSTTVEFDFDSVPLSGRSVVAFETLEYNDRELAIHADIEDQDQTVCFPEIHTSARDKDTGDSQMSASEKATIIDTVVYKNLVAHKEYTLKARLMDKTSGGPLVINDKEVTAELSFIPEEPEGSVDIEIPFDSMKAAGSVTVVFEELYHNDVPVTGHADIDDEGQSVNIPKIRTSAFDKGTNGHTGSIKKKAVINDKVTYTNLIAGKEYKISGVLMDKETGKPLLIGGREIKTEKTFTPEKRDGQIILDYELDASALYGKKIVVFEDLLYKDICVYSHADLNDADQTISYPQKEAAVQKFRSGSSVRTGDMSQIAIPVLLIAAAAAACTAVFVRGRGRHE